MAQAESVTTAIPELMSRGQPIKSTSPAHAAHAEFVAALPWNVPHPIHSEANSEDLDRRGDHLGAVFKKLAGRPMRSGNFPPPEPKPRR